MNTFKLVEGVGGLNCCLGLITCPFKDIDENRLRLIRDELLGNLVALICIVMNVADIFIIDLKAPK
jgi:hypothetical protein